MTIATFNEVRTITKKFNSSSGSTIYELFSFDEFTSSNYTLLSENIFIKNLKAYAEIKSINPATLPNFTLEDTDTDRLYKTLDTEWNSERKQLDLYISTETPNNWLPVGSISLLNPAGYPYRVYNLMDLFTDNLAIELGSDGKVGVAIKDVGYGLLSGNDTVTIHGSCVRELVLDDLPTAITSTVPFSIDVTTNSTTVRTATSGRKNLILVNNSTTDKVFLNLGATAALNRGIVLLPGGSYELNTQDVRYYGELSAIAETTVQLTGIETY